MKADDISFRRATADDADWLVTRHAELYRESDGFDETFGEFVARIVDDYFMNENRRLERGWIAEADGRRLGSIFCTVTDTPEIARLRLFFLEPEARGLGLGGRLLDSCLGFAREAGYRRIVLWTRESHRAACRLYESRGFEKGASTTTTSFGARMIEVDYARDLD
ncbi:GNAT family N-acetyltransferase [Alphaproteobacteria bacterium GH1-50]|uniref:GNAT family N-acetyltransferase n=2 Tax=Kangsaoukella pontilimi TaxID=2691042 RepID=A0A7C9MDL0_9RHOB|nr:GNAT family N-acetyltransferase [Kangsaoukella pontilimi]